MTRADITTNAAAPTGAAIAALNDRFRRSLGYGGKWCSTCGIAALPPLDQLAIVVKVMEFDSFTPDDVHDFGAFEHAGMHLFWKIDYYDRAAFLRGDEVGSANPADPEATFRVLTIMFAQ